MCKALGGHQQAGVRAVAVAKCPLLPEQLCPALARTVNDDCSAARLLSTFVNAEAAGPKRAPA